MKDSNTNIMLEQALACLKIGFVPIPVGIDKKPLISWKPFQSVRPTEEQVTRWFTRFPNANLAIITGAISGISVIDIDPRHGGTNELFKDIKTVISKTGGDGWHYFCKYEEGMRNHTGIKPGVDIRAEAGYVIISPSQHKSGKLYEWIISPFDGTPLAPFPEFVKEWIKEEKVKVYSTNEKNKKGKTRTSTFDPSILEGVSEGQRNSAATSYVGHLLATHPPEEWDSIWEIFVTWNKRNKPPLEESELRGIYESIREKEATKQKQEEEEKSKTNVVKLVEYIQKDRIILFHNELKQGFAAIYGDGREVYKIYKTRLFRQFLARFFYKQFGFLLSNTELDNTIDLLDAKAVFDGPLYELSVRITFKDNAVWYDIGDGSAIFIDKDGWTIAKTPPILFRRYSHQMAQVIPQHNGNIHELLDFINLQSDEDKVLFLVFTVMAFIPGFPHVILVLFGPQGAGKTTPQKILKSLIDPSAIKVLSAPDGEKEFVQIAMHHYFFFFDNLTYLREWLSNSLSRAVTGDGFSKRELFSDDDDVIYSFRRVLALNGIPLMAQKADLLERSILLKLDRIKKKNRRSEIEFWNEFEQKKPFLLGAIFDTVAGAIKKYPDIHLTELPRMADFMTWGCAIADTLGFPQKQFINAYFSNLSRQNKEAIEASPTALAIVEFMKDSPIWEGIATDLYTELEKVATELKIDTKGKLWPKDPSALSRRLHEAHTNLAEEGIQVTYNDSVRPKLITIQKLQESDDNGDKGDMPTESQITEPVKDISGFSQQEINRDNNADSITQSQNDGMSGLSGFSEVVTIPNELLAIQKNPHYGQFFPAQPYERYSDGQLRDALSILTEYEKEIVQILSNNETYEELKNKIQEEKEKRESEELGGQGL